MKENCNKSAKKLKTNMENIDYKRLIKSLNLNQKEFADSLGVSLRSVSNWIKGDYQPTTTVYRNIIKLYGNKLESMVTDNLEEGVTLIKEDKDVLFEIEGNSISGDKIATIIVKNEDYFLKHPVINTMINNIVSRRMVKITESEESFKKWINN